MTADGDWPVLHEGTGLEVSGATVTGQKFLKVDAAVLEATAPLLSLKAGTTFTTSVDAIDLSTKARVTSTVALVKLDGASTLTVLSGSLFSVAGGSYLAVSGGASLVSLLNGSTLDIKDGVLVSLSGASLFKLTGGGSFVSGSTTGPANALKLANAGCAGCTLTTVGAAAIPVLLSGGASTTQISVAAGFTPTTGSVPVTLGTNGAYLKVDGTTAKVVLGP